jgi:small subunit ribosomal protein S1
VVTGTVRNLTDFGAFIELEEGIDGLVHISDLSWTRKVKHPSELVKKGEQVRAVVLRMDPENHRLSLGIKQLQPDNWEGFFSRHQVGDLVKGKITHFASFGAFVELEGGIEGLCHVSQFQLGENFESANPFITGQSHDFRIIRLLPQERKIGLGLESALELTGKTEGIPAVARACAQVGPARPAAANSQAEIEGNSQPAQN